MLSRTADHLYWMARYIERAENMARVLDVTANMSLITNPADQTESALWRPALQICGDVVAYEEAYGECTAANVIKFLTMDDNNPSSIYSTLRSARENARAVRVAMTSETWESINTLWLEFSQFIGADFSKNGLHEFCEWVKARSHLFRGVSFGTMLRDDSFRFLRLGSFIERADNTARILDVKYHILQPIDEETGGVDYYAWSAVLRSVSSFQAYQKVFRDTIDPKKVAEMMVLRNDMPRSLHACYEEIVSIVQQLSDRRPTECKRLSGQLLSSLRYGKMEIIFAQGLHEFLGDFLRSNNRLGGEIQRTFFNAAEV